MSALIFKTKNGELDEAYSVDHKNGRVGGYRLFSGHCESNPFRIFKLNEVLTVLLNRTPKEDELCMEGGGQ